MTGANKKGDKDRAAARLSKGRLGEDYTAAFLCRHGYEIVSRNYKVRGGEIDIIARKGGIIAFVEVKTRKSSSLVSGFAAVDAVKRQRIIKTAVRYMWEEGCDLQPRYDIAQVICDKGKIQKFTYLVAAFDASEVDFGSVF